VKGSALAFLLGVALVGCAQFGGGDRTAPDVPLWFTRPGGAISVTARRVLAADARRIGDVREFSNRRPISERSVPALDVKNGRVFVGTSDHGLYALRASDLSTVWRFETGGAVMSEPLVDNELDLVYFGSHDGALYALRASTGELVWRYNTGSAVGRQPARDGERLFFSNASDYIFAIDRRSGKTLWQAHRTPAMGMEVAGHAGVAFDQNLVFAAFSDGHVSAFSASAGTEAWPEALDLLAGADASIETARYLDVDTTPVVAPHPQHGRVIYVAAYSTGVFAIAASSGTILWRNDRALGVADVAYWSEPAHRPEGMPADAPPLSTPPLLLASSGSTGLWALDPLTGEVQWRVRVPDGGVTAAVPIAGALLVGSTGHGLHLISPLNGKGIDGIDPGLGFSSPPVTFGRTAYALSNAGTLFALQVNPPGR
jgi:outer membrane protein assembly factor BamB